LVAIAVPVVPVPRSVNFS